MMNLTILIVQSLTLAFQEPNIMYWGFLIFSLILQAIVISMTYGYNKKKKIKEDNESSGNKPVADDTVEAQVIKRYERFTTLTKILK